MAEYNMTDREQMDMIKKWWNDYGKILLVAVIVGLLIAFGWRYYRSHKIQQAQAASVLYTQMSLSAAQKKDKSAVEVANTLIKNYASTPYATMAALWLAKEYVNEKKYQMAVVKTEWVLQHTRVNRFKQIARLRMARILLSQKKPQAALEQLKKVEDKTFQPLIEELKGDIYTSIKKIALAQKAYQTAKSELAANNIPHPILDMKLATPKK